jgi:transposase
VIIYRIFHYENLKIVTSCIGSKCYYYFHYKEKEKNKKILTHNIIKQILIQNKYQTYQILSFIVCQYPLRAELEEELERIRHMTVSGKEEAYNILKTELEEELAKIRQMAISEREEKESLKQEYNKLKKEMEAKDVMLSIERENSIVMTTERDQVRFSKIIDSGTYTAKSIKK